MHIASDGDALVGFAVTVGIKRYVEVQANFKRVKQIQICNNVKDNNKIYGELASNSSEARRDESEDEYEGKQNAENEVVDEDNEEESNAENNESQLAGSNGTQGL